MPEIITKRSAIRCARATGEYAFFFSSAGRPLYGAFHPATGVSRTKQVVVVCHAIGTEHMLTQRIETLAARTAAKAGVAAFRYNARAHGDSAGDAHDLTLEDLIEDASAAADMARQLSGASRIIWIGVRVGCLIAANVIDRRDDTHAVAFWEPVHRGDDYIRSLLRATFFTHVAKGRQPSGTVEGMLAQLEQNGAIAVVAGYVYSALYRSIREADLWKSLKWDGQTLIAQIQRRPALSRDNNRLRSEIEKRGGKVSSICVREEPPWTMLTVAKPQWTSDELLTGTKEWLDGLE